MSQPDNNHLNHYEKNRVFQNIIESSNIFLLLLFCYCKIVVKSFVTLRILYLEDCQTTTR